MEENQPKFRVEHGVIVSPKTAEKFAEFERSYLAVREKEKRVLGPNEIKNLPFISKEHPDHLLWQIRRKNIDRFTSYVEKKQSVFKILDLGCGNGFFTNMMAALGHTVTGVDVNLFELKQAATVFGEQARWICLDIMTESPGEEKYDLITFCCSFQYFYDPRALLLRCQKMLNEGGEIHIIDSPFYTEKTQTKAKENSRRYYEGLGEDKMAQFYHHNTLASISEFGPELKYKPHPLLNRIFRRNDSPFPWIMIKAR